MEGEFESLLHTLMPTEGLFHLALEMFRDLWNTKLQSAQGQDASLQKDIKEIERKVTQLLDRIVDASSDTVALAYEKRIKS